MVYPKNKDMFIQKTSLIIEGKKYKRALWDLLIHALKGL